MRLQGAVTYLFFAAVVFFILWKADVLPQKWKNKQLRSVLKRLRKLADKIEAYLRDVEEDGKGTGD